VNKKTIRQFDIRIAHRQQLSSTKRRALWQLTAVLLQARVAVDVLLR